MSTALLLVTVSCYNLGPPEDTTVVFDGQTFTIHAPVSCDLVPDGKLHISAATERGKKLIWVSLTRDPPLVVETVTFRHFDTRGATNNSHEMSATKVDNTYTISGRMPPDEGETTMHQFKIEVSCPNIPEVPTYGPPKPRIPY